MNEIEFRSATVADVNFPKRLIELIVMPYEQPTQVAHNGKMVEEVVTRGAFDGIEQRTSQIRVNRDHDIRRPVGRAAALYPSRQEGLVAELKISTTDLGEETLVLAGDGVLDASAGFLLQTLNGGKGPVRPGAETWERDRSVRRLNHLFLHHVAMTPDPAYTGAKVLAVRDTPGSLQEPAGAVAGAEARPNLDRLKLARWRAQAVELDSRYSSVR